MFAAFVGCCVRVDRCEWRMRWDPTLNPVGLHVLIFAEEQKCQLVCVSVTHVVALSDRPL